MIKIRCWKDIEGLENEDFIVVLGENGSKRLLADNGSAIFYSEVLGSYGMCDKNGKIRISKG